MAQAKLIVVVLAAGKGTRLRSELAKVLHRAGGRTLVEHVVRACQPLGAEIFVVVGHQADEVRAIVTPLGCRTILQEPLGGTGHALEAAKASIEGRGRVALVVPGDAPLVRTETLRALVEQHERSGAPTGQGAAAVTILTAELDDPTGYGRIVRQANGSVAAIVEENALWPTQRAIREVNSSIYCFTLAKLWPCLAELRPENVHRELYLTDAIALLNKRGERVDAVPAADPAEALGANTRAELAEVDRILRQRKAAALMESGVTIYLPETVLIDPDVEVGADTVIEPAVQLLGKTRIGRGCTVRTGSVLADAVLEDDVVVRQHCLVAASRLGQGTVVGPFAHLRDGAVLEPGARVGNYVEVKKSVLGEGVKAMHLSYLGDATIGRDTNIGAGTITCNFDGVRKNPTRIGERVFVGSGTELVAPIEVGDGAYIAAGSTVTENVPADALAIARGRQATKLGWAAERRARMAAMAQSQPESATGASAAPGTGGGGAPAPRAAKSKAAANPDHGGGSAPRTSGKPRGKRRAGKAKRAGKKRK
jgi:bifunctional UDP-N-acetylglucosamine pyrophosphorylase / glucosamine-1-phosphate N-acetyltransferase